MGIGAGCYALCRLDQARLTKARHYLVMLNPKLARGIRALDEYALIGLRPDEGRDWEQVDASRAPEAEADRWADLIRGRVAEVGPGVYNYTLGINEPLGMAHDWLAAFEHGICRRVQYGDGMPADWRQLPYAALSGQVGHLEPAEVVRFRKVLEIAWAVNFHAYLKEMVPGLLQEPDDYYVWRPLRLLMPEIVKINPRISLLLGECGTYYPPARTGISKDDEARVQIGIAQAYEMEAAKRGYNFAGAICYGIGLDGDQRETWDLSEQVGIFAAANRGAAQPPAPQPPVVVRPPVSPAPQPGGKKMSWYDSPLHDGPRPRTTCIIVHSTRGGTGDPMREYIATQGWFRNAKATGSAHAVVGPNGEEDYPVGENLIAWHDWESNQFALGIELPQSGRGDPIPAPAVARATVICARWAVKYKIPIVRGYPRGFVEHKDTPPGKAHGKSDVGPPFNLDAFLAEVRREAAALAPKPKINWQDLVVYGQWSLARCANRQDPRDLAAFRAHLKALGCADDPWRYGWPAR